MYRQSIRCISEKLTVLKQEFARMYSGSGHIQEILPREQFCQIDCKHLQQMDRFANYNPIYYNSFAQDVSGVKCTVYEGDINSYWLNSTKHGASCQPFYPTWILSAYAIALNVKNIGCRMLVDVGSGDGRIAYCASMLGLESHAIEIDETLVRLQSEISKKTGVSFQHTCADAITIDYNCIDLPAAFCIGGLPQMGGDVLADAIVEKILKENANAVFVFAGSHSKKGPYGSIKNGGWDTLIKRYHLEVLGVVTLPTVWTFDQDADTPYIFTRLV